MDLDPKMDWRELTSRKEEFQHILRILNHYYEASSQTRSELYKFRSALVASPADSIRIFLSKVGSYEYFVAASLEKKALKFETWVHIDGIAEERVKLKEIGKLEHPVFSITCLEDLYANDTLQFQLDGRREKKLAKRK